MLKNQKSTTSAIAEQPENPKFMYTAPNAKVFEF